MRDTVWDEHEAILEAINCGDADRAKQLARSTERRPDFVVRSNSTVDVAVDESSDAVQLRREMEKLFAPSAQSVLAG